MELHFLRPYWLLAFIPLTYIFLHLRKYSQNNNWFHVCDDHLLPYLLVKPSNSVRFSPLILLGISWLLATIALSGPSFTKEKQSIYRLADSRMIVMSLSPSMYSNDGSTTRILRARFKMLDLLGSLHEGQTGLVVYSGESHTVVPLTEDNNTIKNLVPILDPSLMPVEGDNLVAGLKEAQKLFHQAKISQGQIILLADKITDQGRAEAMVRLLNKDNIQLFILDLSSDKDQSNGLKKLTKLGNGSYVKVTPTNSDVQDLIKKMTNKSVGAIHTDKKIQAASLWKDQGIWFAFLIIPLVLLAFSRGYLA